MPKAPANINVYSSTRFSGSSLILSCLTVSFSCGIVFSRVKRTPEGAKKKTCTSSRNSRRCRKHGRTSTYKKVYTYCTGISPDGFGRRYSISIYTTTIHSFVRTFGGFKLVLFMYACSFCGKTLVDMFNCLSSGATNYFLALLLLPVSPPFAAALPTSNCAAS